MQLTMYVNKDLICLGFGSQKTRTYLMILLGLEMCGVIFYFTCCNNHAKNLHAVDMFAGKQAVANAFSLGLSISSMIVNERIYLFLYLGTHFLFLLSSSEHQRRSVLQSAQTLNWKWGWCCVGVNEK